VLIVTGKYAGDRANPWLLDDLAAELAHAGHTVDVIVFDPTGARPKGRIPLETDGINAWSIGSTRMRVGGFQKLLGYLQTGLGLHFAGFRFVKGKTYDLCIYTSIASFSWGFPSRVRRKRIATKLVLILWDFFPIHQLDIGRIRREPANRLMKAIERLAITRADVVALMSPANERFFRSYFPQLKAKTTIIPPWSSSGDLYKSEALKRPRFTALFGGQLVAGRGVDTLLDAAGLLATSGEPIDIVIAGDGPDRRRLEAAATSAGLSNVTFTGALPREDYRTLLASVHAGIAITVAGVSPPSFPSKIVEYCGLGIPVVVCVESSSDAGEIVEQHGAGIMVDAGDAPGVAEAIRRLYAANSSGELATWSDAARRFYLSQLSTAEAVRRLEMLVAGRSVGR
jgi:glycosyltransferase involved in cell wall biosynthesis